MDYVPTDYSQRSLVEFDALNFMLHLILIYLLTVWDIFLTSVIYTWLSGFKIWNLMGNFPCQHVKKELDLF